MSTSHGRTAPQPQRRAHRFCRTRILIGRCSTGTRRSQRRNATDDLAFWAQLEAREEGRLALEADHLFDTSYRWTA